MPKLYLETFYDPSEPIDPNWSPDATIAKNTTRLAKEAALGWLVANHKRRLGQQATLKELAKDKQFAKRYGFGAEDMLRHWGQTETDIEQAVIKAMQNPKLKRQAAQLDWHEHIHQQIVYLRQEMRQAARNAVHQDRTKYGNKFVTYLENEINQTGQRYERVFGTQISLQKLVDLEKTPKK